MLSFGGICVAMQTASAIGELPLRSYLLGKLLQGLVVVCLTAAFLYRIPVLLLLPVLILRTAKKVVAKGRHIVYNDPINQRRKPYAVS
jgi:hypothetical protein